MLAQVDDGYPPRRLMSGGVGFGAGTLCGAVVGISGLILVIVGAARRRRSGREIIAWDRTHRPMPGSGHERYPGGPRVPPAYVNPPGDPFRAPPA